MFLSHTVRTVATAVVVLGALAVAPGAASAAPATPGAGATPHAVKLPAPITPTMRSSRTDVTNKSDCPTVRANLKSYAAKGQKTASCTTVGSTPPKGRATPNVVPPCATLEPLVWWFTRDGACQIIGVEDTVFDAESGEIVGEAWFEIEQDLSLTYNRTIYFENETITFVEGLGAGDVTYDLNLVGYCSGSCQVLDGSAWDNIISPGQTVYGQTVYEGETAGPRTYSDTGYVLQLVNPFSISTGPVYWGGPPSIRCDGELTNLAAGCVFPQWTPAWAASVARFGAAALNVDTAEVYLPDGWGLVTPLTRLTDQVVIAANRAAICAGFRYHDPNDSCDEYAFASTYQSGAQLGLGFNDCAEVDYTQVAGGQWVWNEVRWTGHERCLVGHVNVNDNKALGLALANELLTPYRVLDGDPYYVYATA